MSEEIPTALGNAHANIVPYQTFKTADGEMVIAVGNDNQFKTLCRLIEKPNYAADPRFKTNPDRVENRKEIVPLLQKEFSKQPTAYWQEKCKNNNIPCGPSQNIAEVADDPQLQARDMLTDYKHPAAGDIKMIGSPLKLSRPPVSIRQHPPVAGEHNKEIFSKIKNNKERI